MRLGQLQKRRGQTQQEMTTLADDRRYDEVKVELACVQEQIAQQVAAAGKSWRPPSTR